MKVHTPHRPASSLHSAQIHCENDGHKSERQNSLIMRTASTCTYFWYHSQENILQRIVNGEKKGGYILSAFLVWLSRTVRAQYSFLRHTVCPNHPKATHQIMAKVELNKTESVQHTLNRCICQKEL
jgi:hypothetical protein